MKELLYSQSSSRRCISYLKEQETCSSGNGNDTRPEELAARVSTNFLELPARGLNNANKTSDRSLSSVENAHHLSKEKRDQSSAYAKSETCLRRDPPSTSGGWQLPSSGVEELGRAEALVNRPRTKNRMRNRRHSPL